MVSPVKAIKSAAVESTSNVEESLKIQHLFKVMAENNASDLHLSVGVYPSMRVNGKIIKVKLSPLTAEDTKNLVYQVFTEEQKMDFEKKKRKRINRH